MTKTAIFDMIYNDEKLQDICIGIPRKTIQYYINLEIKKRAGQNFSIFHKNLHSFIKKSTNEGFFKYFKIQNSKIKKNNKK